MKKPQRKPDRAAVARSLHELELLFGKKPPATKQNTQRTRLGAVNLLTRQLKRGDVR